VVENLPTEHRAKVKPQCPKQTCNFKLNLRVSVIEFVKGREVARLPTSKGYSEAMTKKRKEGKGKAR
jgi:hypothetical protein